MDNDKEYMNFYLEEHPELIQADLDNDIDEITNYNNEITTPNLPNTVINICLRCLEEDFFLIPYIKINKDKDNNIMIKNKKYTRIVCVEIIIKEKTFPIVNYISLLDKKLEDILCSIFSFNREKDKNIRLYFCYKCKKYFCNLEKCNNNHEKQCENNDLIQLEKLNSYCLYTWKEFNILL